MVYFTITLNNLFKYKCVRQKSMVQQRPQPGANQPELLVNVFDLLSFSLKLDHFLVRKKLPLINTQG